MPIGQTLLIAVGLSILILGWLYAEWRSRRQDRTGLRVRRLLDAVVASGHLGIGIAIGIPIVRQTVPQRLMLTGVAILISSKSLLMVANWSAATSATPPLKRVPFRAYLFATATGGVLFGVGVARFGGLLGTLGAAVALGWALLHGGMLWVSLFVPNGVSAAKRNE